MGALMNQSDGIPDSMAVLPKAFRPCECRHVWKENTDFNGEQPRFVPGIPLRSQNQKPLHVFVPIATESLPILRKAERLESCMSKLQYFGTKMAHGHGSLSRRHMFNPDGGLGMMFGYGFERTFDHLRRFPRQRVVKARYVNATQVIPVGFAMASAPHQMAIGESLESSMAWCKPEGVMARKTKAVCS